MTSLSFSMHKLSRLRRARRVFVPALPPPCPGSRLGTTHRTVSVYLVEIAPAAERDIREAFLCYADRSQPIAAGCCIGSRMRIPVNPVTHSRSIEISACLDLKLFKRPQPWRRRPPLASQQEANTPETAWIATAEPERGSSATRTSHKQLPA